MWTLQYFGPGGTVEKPFPLTATPAGWGISGECPFEFHNTAKGAVHLITTDDFDTAFQFAYNSKIVVWRDRAYAGGAFSGGTIFFQGYVAQPARNAAGAKQNHAYTLYDWIGWAERIGFRQPYRIRSGGTYLAPIYTVEYTDEVCLGETVDELVQDVAEQITEILNSLNQRYNPTRWRSYVGVADASKDLVQIGTIGVAGVPMPRNPTRCIVCYEALRECLKQVPDAVLWTDHTTTPPTVNVTKLADMVNTTLTLPSVDITSIFTGLTLKPRYDRQLNGVLIAYKMPGTITTNGVAETVMQFYFDKWPLTCDPDDPLVMSYVVELAGARSDKTIVTVMTTPVAAADPDDATRVAWWVEHDARLQHTRIVPNSLAVDVTSVTVTDSRTGAVISLTDFPYQLMPDSGAPTPGMGVNVRQVTIKANGSWHKYLPDIDLESQKETDGQLIANITICDLDTAGVAEKFTYTTVEETGESAPTTLATYLYNAFKDLKHAGQIDTKGHDIRGDVAIGHQLTIVTPGNNFPGNLIQSVSGELFHGVLKAEIGPPGVLGLTDIIEQLRVVRYIANWKLPSGRATGSPSGGSSTSLANTSARENTIPGFGEPSLHTVSAPFTPP